MNFVELDFQGKSLRIPALKYQGKLWFHWQGETHVLEIQTQRRSGGDKSKTHPGVLAAPMPGKITQAKVKLGDSVSKGQALVVMEAMKMEYTLEADREGVITAVNAEVGKQVGLGDILVRIGDA